MKRKPNGLLLFVLGHVLLAAWTWRDIQQRPARQIRGSKRLWRLLSAANTWDQPAIGWSGAAAGRLGRTECSGSRQRTRRRAGVASRCHLRRAASMKAD